MEKQKTPLAFVKANVKKKDPADKPSRFLRDGQFNWGRHKMQASQSVEHRIVMCQGSINRINLGVEFEYGSSEFLKRTKGALSTKSSLGQV